MKEVFISLRYFEEINISATVRHEENEYSINLNKDDNEEMVY